MARVIKGGGGDGGGLVRRPAARIGQPAAQKRSVIEKEVYRAQVRAGEIRREAEEQRERILVDGKRQAAQLREEAQSEGAAEAFAQAAAEALVAFRRRAERYAEAADDIRVLALEVVKKVLGHAPKLSERALTAIVAQGMNRLRARRKLRVQLPESRLLALNRERPALVAAINREPDIVLETVLDVSAGYCRIVTEVGGALCTEQSALDTLAEAVDVDEHAVAPPPKSPFTGIDDDDDDDDNTDPHRHRPSRPPPPPAHASAPLRAGVALSVTAPDLRVPDIENLQVAKRARPMTSEHDDVDGYVDEGDPDATNIVDVDDLRARARHPPRPKAPDPLDDDDLDLHVDDSVPER